MIGKAIANLVEMRDLTAQEALECFTEIMEGRASPAQISSFLTAMRMKGETVIEIASCARSMQKHMCAISPRVNGNLLDTCGSGGGAIKNFNVSTIAAFVACGAGCYVAKHGNRAITSKSGSADVLEALEIKIDLPPERVQAIIEKIGIGFLYAPACSAAMKFASPVRREIGIRTIFNILGPIANPANAQCRLLGVYDLGLAEKIANALQELKVENALVVHGADGLDEISTLGETVIYELHDGRIKKYSIVPEQFGIVRADEEDIAGGSAEENARIALDVLQGKEIGAKRDIVLLNAGAAIYISGKAQSIQEGIKLAKQAISSGKALEKLQALKRETNA